MASVGNIAFASFTGGGYRGHGAQARNLALRQRQLYGAVDAVLSPSAADLARVRVGVMG